LPPRDQLGRHSSVCSGRYPCCLGDLAIINCPRRFRRQRRIVILTCQMRKLFRTSSPSALLQYCDVSHRLLSIEGLTRSAPMIFWIRLCEDRLSPRLRMRADASVELLSNVLFEEVSTTRALGPESFRPRRIFGRCLDQGFFDCPPFFSVFVGAVASLVFRSPSLDFS